MIDFKNKYVFIYEIAQKESRLLMTKRLLLTGPRHRSRERERERKKKKKKKDGLGSGEYVGRWGKLEEGSVEPMIRGQDGLVSWRWDLFLRQFNYFILLS